MNTLADFFTPGSELVGGFAIAVAIATALIHVTLAISVWSDALYLERKQRLWFMGSFFWAVATLLAGLLAAAAYWLMHRSSIATPPQAAQSTSQT